MNLTEDFIAIQGILLSIEKSNGPLKDVKYRGGNEGIILSVTTELYNFLLSKNYIKNKKINAALDTSLENFCTFLIINTEVNNPVTEPEFQHLLNIIPQFSPCLLANVITALDLSKYFSQSLRRFDLDLIAEFLQETILCLKKCPPRDHLTHANEFLKLIIEKLSIKNCNEEAVEKLTNIANQMLRNLTYLHGEQLEKIKIDSVYECMGYTLLNLLDLLLMCDIKNSYLNSMITSLAQSACNVMAAVTIDVFCCWAEIEHEDVALQTLVAEKAYIFLEKYQKHPSAKELISMLSTIAQQPKTISEKIRTADDATIIAMVNKADSNQKNWFTALLNTEVLKSKDSIKCIERWSHLLTGDDVSRLLNMGATTKDDSIKKLIINCAAILDYEVLVLTTTRHFHHNGINFKLSSDNQPQLILLFNKIKDKNMGDEFSKELYLLLLQNLEETLLFTFTECTKNSFYSTNLISFWGSVKDVISIDNIGITVLNNVLKENIPNEKNVNNYVVLLNTLMEQKVFRKDKVLSGVALPFLQESLDNKNYLNLKNGMEILNDANFEEVHQEFFFLIFKIMELCRCNFLNFEGVKQQIVHLCVSNFNKFYSGSICKDMDESSDDFFVKFYKKRLSGHNNLVVQQHFFPINFENHAEIVAHLIKILPLCVTSEWLMIASSLINSCSLGKTIELFCDCLILLCELVKSQESKTEEVKSMFLAMAYCLQNFGIVIKDCFRPKINDLNEDAILNKNVCRLLKDIPSGNLKSEEGLSLANLLSETSLRSLRNDKKFASLVASIKEPHICKMLAQKILV